MIGGDSKFVLTCKHTQTRVPFTPIHTHLQHIHRNSPMRVEIRLFPIQEKEKENSPVSIAGGGRRILLDLWWVFFFFF